MSRASSESWQKRKNGWISQSASSARGGKGGGLAASLKTVRRIQLALPGVDEGPCSGTVRLSDLRELLEEAWRRIAPKRVAEARLWISISTRR